MYILLYLWPHKYKLKTSWVFRLLFECIICELYDWWWMYKRKKILKKSNKMFVKIIENYLSSAYSTICMHALLARLLELISQLQVVFYLSGLNFHFYVLTYGLYSKFLDASKNGNMWHNSRPLSEMFSTKSLWKKV